MNASPPNIRFSFSEWPPHKSGRTRSASASSNGMIHHHQLGLASDKRVLIGTSPVDHWDRNLKQTEIHRQLAPMMVPVVQHDGAQQSDPRFAEHFFSSQRQTPGPQCRLLTHAFKALLSGLSTLVESCVNLFQVIRSRRFEIGLGSVKLFELRQLRQAARNTCDMKRQLAERH